jgi:hypothetical protein
MSHDFGRIGRSNLRGKSTENGGKTSNSLGTCREGGYRAGMTPQPTPWTAVAGPVLPRDRGGGAGIPVGYQADRGRAPRARCHHAAAIEGLEFVLETVTAVGSSGELARHLFRECWRVGTGSDIDLCRAFGWEVDAHSYKVRMAADLVAIWHNGRITVDGGQEEVWNALDQGCDALAQFNQGAGLTGRPERLSGFRRRGLPAWRARPSRPSKLDCGVRRCAAWQ